MPILHKDRLIGRMDPEVDRARNVLVINTVHSEPDAPTTRSAVTASREAVEDLAKFLSVRGIEFSGRLPRGWARLSSRLQEEGRILEKTCLARAVVTMRRKTI